MVRKDTTDVAITDFPIYGTPEVAERLRIRESSLRRLVIQMNDKGDKVGRKVTERSWVFTEADVKKLESRPNNRGKWQQDGGRRAYLDRIKQQEGSRPTS